MVCGLSDSPGGSLSTFGIVADFRLKKFAALVAKIHADQIYFSNVLLLTADVK